MFYEENQQYENQSFSLTDFVNQSTHRFLGKSKKKTEPELFRSYQSFGMTLLELIAQKKTEDSKQRKF